MQIVKYICDRCGAEVDKAFMMLFGNDKTGFPNLPSDDMDFCPDCAREIAEFAAKKIRKPEKRTKPEQNVQKPEQNVQKPEQNVQKPEQKPKIDAGKIGALFNAGWSVYQIAKEMHCGFDDVIDVLVLAKRDGKLEKEKPKPLEKWCTGEGDDVLTQNTFDSASVVLKE